MAMAMTSCHINSVSITNLLDMNEDIFLEIFQYLKDELIYFSLRSVSRKLKLCVDAYLELAGIFLTVAGRDNTTEVLYVLERRDHVRTIILKNIEPYPYPPPFYHQEKISTRCCVTQTKTVMIRSLSDLGSFSANIKGTVIIGTHSYCMEVNYKPRNYRNKINVVNVDQDAEESWKNLEKKTVKASWPFDLKRYEVSLKKWVPIKSVVELDQNFDYLMGSGKPIKFWCLLGDSSLLTFYDEINITYTRLIQINISKPHFSKFHGNTFSSRLVTFPYQLVGISQFSVIRVAKQQVLLVGGIKIHNHTKPNLSLWMGTLTKNGRNLTWVNTNSKVTQPRIKPLCFKLNNNVYITGGEGHLNGDKVDLLCCDRYNLESNVYSSCVYTLPYPLNYDDAYVATNVNETFALILDERKKKVLFFTEEKGIEEYKKFYPNQIKPNTKNRILLCLK